jgi:2-hydroxychromene-2-carboxylate isomerase
MTRSDPILFYFDFISHNAYIAWTQIHELAARHGRRVEPIPVLFAGFLEAYGQRGPAEIPAKNAWMIRDVLRKAARLDLRMAPPHSHPFNPLLALRLVSQPLDAAVRVRLIDRAFRAVWTESRAVDDVDTLAAIAIEVGLDGPACVAACADPVVKQALRTQTEEALRVGVFGVPSMRVDDELFWGYDDFPSLESWLRGEDPLDRTELERWARVRPSVERRQR